MKTSAAFGTKLVTSQRTPARARAAPVSASLREDVAR